MKRIYKVSLFDDSKQDVRTELGLNSNNGFVFITDDYNTARDVYNNEIDWLNKNCKSYSLASGRNGISVNICTTYNLDRWNWNEQSDRDYVM